MPPVSQFPKKPFEIRDPVHGFISLNETEQRVIDTRPLQRLKHIHQLAMTYQIYPGATHKRFEHSLGVMELAGRAFDVVTKDANLPDINLAELVDDVDGVSDGDHSGKLRYWRQALRLAGLCHDVGHPPFSHAAEKDWFTKGHDHETVGGRLILENEELLRIWKSCDPAIDPEHVVKLAIGDKASNLSLKHAGQSRVNLSDWERVLASMIVGDALGVDRMDYLSRDSHHLGVPYGRFDIDRLMASMRLIPEPRLEEGSRIGEFSRPGRIQLGISHGGLHAIEGLILARFFMHMQVYFHHARVSMDQHLKSFVRCWHQSRIDGNNMQSLLDLTDNEVLVAVSKAARAQGSEYHDLAIPLHERRHFVRIRDRAPSQLAGEKLDAFEKLAERFVESFRHPSTRFVETVGAPEPDVLVRLWSGEVQRFSQLTDVVRWPEKETMKTSMGRGYIFVPRGKRCEAERHLAELESSLTMGTMGGDHAD